MNRMLEPRIQQGLAEATIAAPSVGGIEFKPDIAKMLAYPERRWTSSACSRRTGPSSTRAAPGWSRRCNQIFGA